MEHPKLPWAGSHSNPNRNLLVRLPNEMISTVCSFMDASSMNNLAQTCRTMGDVVTHALYRADIESDDCLSLWWACKTGRVDTLRLFLEAQGPADYVFAGSNPHTRQNKDTSALTVALRSAQPAIVERLLVAGASCGCDYLRNMFFDKLSSSSWQFLALLHDNSSTIIPPTSIIGSANLNRVVDTIAKFYRDPPNSEPMPTGVMSSAWKTINKIVAMLLAEKNMTSTLPLTNACGIGMPALQLVEQLLEHGLDPNGHHDGDYLGWTALHEACVSANTSLELIELLFSYSADIHVVADLGYTLLHRICWNMRGSLDERLKIIRFLVRHGIALNVGDNDGYAALDVTALLMTRPDSMVVAKALVRAGGKFSKGFEQYGMRWLQSSGQAT